MGTVAGAGHPMDPASISWHDTKRYAWLLGLAIPMLPFVAAGLVKATGITVFWWLGPLFVFGIVPVLDTLVGKDSENPPDSMIASLEGDRYYRWCLYLFLPLQFAALVGACFEWSSGSLSVVDCLGLAATMGVVGGAGICTAHELGHKSEKVERWLSKITLAQTGYGHFFVEHNRGHHVRVATPEDPASSRLGESFWAFLPRTVRGSLVSAWEIEKLRLRLKGKPAFSLENDAVNAWVMTVALYGNIAGRFREVDSAMADDSGGAGLQFAGNYLEHYGLARRKLPDGRFEPCAQRHSWNSNQIVSNVLLYHLQRHSDHHAYPSRRYQSLRSYEEAPELPSGYGTMAVIALIPPLWRNIMDPKVIAHYGGRTALANVHPSRRQRYGLDGEEANGVQ
ncbi:MAG TPA: alkane 1-monooxygenase [Bryobacteraceae bacterium]|nr:alkane 1-monooxygenase [Bryobacteraceae bacterium]